MKSKFHEEKLLRLLDSTLNKRLQWQKPFAFKTECQTLKLLIVFV